MRGHMGGGAMSDDKIFICPKCKKGRAFRIGREKCCEYLECLKCDAKIWLGDTAGYLIRQELEEMT